MKLLIGIMFSLILSFHVRGQARDPFRWPRDTAQAKTQWVLLSDAVKAQRYADALEPFQWLLEQAPDLHASLYIQGEKMYKGLIEKAPEKSAEEKYLEDLLYLYDQRMQYFQDEANVSNRKVLTAYQYDKNRKDKYPELLTLFEKAFQAHAQHFTPANLIAYMDVIRLVQAEEKQLTDEEVLNRYDRISQLLQSQDIGEAATEKQALVDKLLLATITLDCTVIEEKFGKPFLEKHPQDLSRAKRIIALSLAYQCKDLPVFSEAAQLVHQQEPTYGIARMLALMHDSKENYPLAEKYYKEAITLAQEKEKQADMYYALAQHYQRRAMKVQARTAALQAAETNPSLKEAYKLVGDLYLSSFDVCKKGESATLDRAVYIAAYEMYQKAGRTDMMEVTRQQFPTIEQIFQEGYEEGQKVQTGCWINEQVTLLRP